MEKQLVNFRLSREAVKALDSWAQKRNISRTAMLEIVLWAERERQNAGLMAAGKMSDFIVDLPPIPNCEITLSREPERASTPPARCSYSQLDAVSDGKGKASVEKFTRPLERPRPAFPKPGGKKK